MLPGMVIIGVDLRLNLLPERLDIVAREKVVHLLHILGALLAQLGEFCRVFTDERVLLAELLGGFLDLFVGVIDRPIQHQRSGGRFGLGVQLAQDLAGIVLVVLGAQLLDFLGIFLGNRPQFLGLIGVRAGDTTAA